MGGCYTKVFKNKNENKMKKYKMQKDYNMHHDNTFTSHPNNSKNNQIVQQCNLIKRVDMEEMQEKEQLEYVNNNEQNRSGNKNEMNQMQFSDQNQNKNVQKNKQQKQNYVQNSNQNEDDDDENQIQEEKEGDIQEQSEQSTQNYKKKMEMIASNQFNQVGIYENSLSYIKTHTNKKLGGTYQYIESMNWDTIKSGYQDSGLPTITNKQQQRLNQSNNNESFKKQDTQQQVFYNILNQLGKGSQGEVIKIFDNKNQCYYAQKSFFKANKSEYFHEKQVNQQLVKEFGDEVELHEMAVKLIDFNDKELYLIFNYGQMTLADFCEQKFKLQKFFKESEIWYIMVSLCRHLKKLHSKKIYHCDVKPQNILLFLEYSFYKLKLADFGVSTYDQQDHIGHTPWYYPELYSDENKEIKDKNDRFGVGITVLEIMVKNAVCQFQNKIQSSDLGILQKFLTKKMRQYETVIDIIEGFYSKEIIQGCKQLVFQQEFTFCEKEVSCLDDEGNLIYNAVNQEKNEEQKRKIFDLDIKMLVNKLNLCLNSEVLCYEQATLLTQSLENKGLASIQQEYQDNQIQFCYVLYQMGMAKFSQNEYAKALEYYCKAEENLKQQLQKFQSSQQLNPRFFRSGFKFKQLPPINNSRNDSQNQNQSQSQNQNQFPDLEDFQIASFNKRISLQQSKNVSSRFQNDFQDFKQKNNQKRGISDFGEQSQDQIKIQNQNQKHFSEQSAQNSKSSSSTGQDNQFYVKVNQEGNQTTVSVNQKNFGEIKSYTDKNDDQINNDININNINNINNKNNNNQYESENNLYNLGNNQQTQRGKQSYTNFYKQKSIDNKQLQENYKMQQKQQEEFLQLEEEEKIILELLSYLYFQMGQIYYQLGDLERAQFFLQKSLDTQPLNIQDGKLVNYYKTLQCHQFLGKIYTELGEFEKGEQKLRDCLENLESILRQTEEGNQIKVQMDKADTYLSLATLYNSQGKFEQSRIFNQKCLDIYEKILSQEREEMAICYNNLANDYSNLGNISNAENFYKKSLQIKEKIFDANDLELAQGYWNLGLLYYKHKINYGQIQSILKKAQSIFQKNGFIQKVNQLEQIFQKLQEINNNTQEAQKY
ncbi:Protein kinase-like domain [Pseudocohnilembus persalinus]|uniref:Protein kinase-like domain n=1 Tax=Pseudocohnilembus persalinus TaxID=266149 RepID=A0A0V0QBD9_PSEPJ|nr:Protein kinase-like domain [Pseudocohnilembus persalinus]|eukprot:KRW99564.1 Protein kinase-like domain [Pseudocohnilembus persalinus]